MSQNPTSSDDSLVQQIDQIHGQLRRIQSISGQIALSPLQSSLTQNLSQIEIGLDQIAAQAKKLEDEHLNLRALTQIGQIVNSSLELDEVLRITMDTIIRLTNSERGFLMLKNDQGNLDVRIARNWSQESLEASEFAVSTTVIRRVITEGKALLTTNAQEDPRLQGQQSIMAHNLRSILCVPLKVKGQLTGVIYADNRIRSGLFTHKELELLSAFANQAAVAIENARLFVTMRKTLAEVSELKNLMENILSSIASGVLTENTEGIVLQCNQAAALILGIQSRDLVGNYLNKTAGSLADWMEPHLQKVLKHDQAVLGLEISPVLSQRGELDLRLNLTPLKDSAQKIQGVAVVLEDETEKKRLEAQRKILTRMVSPAVIDQIDADSLKPGGFRRNIGILFADIRGFTSFSEGREPEELVSILNRYLASAADAVLNEEGTVDKFLGDAIMAWFNAPLVQEDYVLRAVRAAINIRAAQSELQRILPEDCRLFFGVGIHVGDAIIGLIGTEKRLEYTAIGDCVNTARRIQENARPGQILISRQAYLLVQNSVEVQPVESILAKGKREPLVVYEVVGLKPVNLS